MMNGIEAVVRKLDSLGENDPRHGRILNQLSCKTMGGVFVHLALGSPERQTAIVARIEEILSGPSELRRS
jgi:hypothetical protein